MTYTPQPTSRSLGLKLIVILALIVLMAIPVMFISFISFDRSSRADEVTREVSRTYGGQQRLLGPVLVVPYRETLANGGVREGDYVVSALQGEAAFADITVEEKSRSLYKVPVYTADGALTATLPSLDALPEAGGLMFDRSQARIVVGIGDVTGLQADITLNADGQTLTFEPFSRTTRYRSDRMMRDIDVDIEPALELAVEPAIGLARDPARTVEVLTDRLQGGGLTLLSVPATDLLLAGERDVSVSLRVTGAQSLSVIPFARSTRVSLTSDWPHPGFEGRFPPGDRSISEDGFSADWSVPFLRRGIPADGRAMDMTDLIHTGPNAMQVNFVSPLNPYQTVNRALKYAVLFIGLVFLAYFLMETLLGVRVHPAQYLLIGIAQAIFYLLLLAFAEHVGFTTAFLISAVATVALTAGYAGAVFGRNKMSIAAFVFASVYALLFVLMRIQDFALMVGALVSFIAIAATLYLTRNLNWYGDKMSDPES